VPSQMVKILLILVWPAVIVSIVCAAALVSRREPDVSRITGGDRVCSDDGVRRRWPGMTLTALPWRAGLLRLAVILAGGALLVYGVMALLGLLVVHNGLTLDRPIYDWTIAHQIHLWTRVMHRLTKIGDTWTTWGAAAAAAVCMAVTWRRNRWLPPVALGSLIVIDHFLTLALRHTFHRLGPPDSPLGTYPSGGCARVVVFYGLIAYLLWHEYSGRRRAAVWAAASVAALAFNEGYSRAYLTLHWSTDIVSGWLYGALLLAVFIIAVRFVAGPPIARESSSTDSADTRRPSEHPISEPAGYVRALRLPQGTSPWAGR
jgi:membrane-associated phospholipid phosphatase